MEQHFARALPTADGLAEIQALLCRMAGPNADASADDLDRDIYACAESWMQLESWRLTTLEV